MYALRRERQHIERMQRTCISLGTNAECSVPLLEALAGVDRDLKSSFSYTFERRILMPTFERFRTLVTSLSNRSCGGLDADGPCIRDAITPIVTSQGDVATIRGLIGSLQQSFFQLDAERRRVNLQRTKDLFSSPLKTCLISRNQNALFEATCRVQLRQILGLETAATSLKPWSWLREDDDKEMRSLFDSCWIHCILPWSSVLFVQNVLLSRKFVLTRLLPATLVEFCETDSCIQAALAEIKPVTMPDAALSIVVSAKVVDRLIWALGLFFTCVILVLSILLGVFVLFVWKIRERVQFHFIFLLLLIGSLVCQMVFWGFQGVIDRLIWHLSFTISQITMISTALMFGLMGKDWAVAFIFLVSRKGMLTLMLF